MTKLAISFSGGETSAFMTKRVLESNEYHSRYDDIKVIFANTGQENEETLEFIHQCDKYYHFNTIWVEAEVYHDTRESTGGKVVSFETASRDGKPFEEIIKKYGIPNSKFKQCTRELKLNPIKNYLKSIGWIHKEYDTAIGIRTDEIDRISSKAKENRVIYPLIKDFPTSKIDVNTFWNSQPFRLNLKGYQGNCKWCWKKSFRKHLTLIKERPEIYEFPRRMEKDYGLIGPEFTKHQVDKDYKRVFFRGNKSVEDLFKMYEEQKDKFIPASDDSIVYNSELDINNSCEESCEVYSDEDS